VPGHAEWIALDWGTSNVRAWAMSGDEAVVSTSSEKGMARLAAPDYPGVLEELIDALGVDLPRPCPILACGMVGARQGWTEAAYLELPADLGQLGSSAVRPENRPADREVHILSGVCQRGSTEDVMRGEETQLLGLMALHAEFAGLACLPGTHSKWARISDGRLVEFSTSMTGELYEVLSRHSVLRHSMGEPRDPQTHADGLDEGLTVGLDTPEKLTSLLFRTRAASLLSGKDPDWCAGYLSGVLIGAEVAGQRGARGDGPIMLVGSESLCSLYASAIKKDGGTTETIDATHATLAGLNAARKQIQK